MRAYSGVARAEKILSEEEIGTVEAIVAAVGAGRVGAQFRDATQTNGRNEDRGG
ncbi:MAG TPA: hypothetical protein QF901_01465 [Gammaproteobacteria bacterium]|jgi:hypothetical protein|nr:hypothetical protein [Gammaproteobacteria bacterium]